MADAVTSTLAGLPAVTGQVTPTAKSTLDKDSFLKLLTTQLQNQDPLQPTDNMEFVSQMANFSTLEQMTNMTSTMEKFLTSMASSYKVEAMSYLGLKVTAQPADQPDAIVGTVKSVKFVDGEAVLKVGETEVKLSDIQKIEYPDAA